MLAVSALAGRVAPHTRGIALGGTAASMRRASRRVSPLHCSAPVADAGSVEAQTAGSSEGGPVVKKRILSGVQPTGVLHLGNYLGAINQWVANQDLYDNYFCVVDSHAITQPHDPKELTLATYRTAALYLASGIDPKRSRIFVQSHVSAHSELMWMLNCATPMNWLERMIQCDAPLCLARPATHCGHFARLDWGDVNGLVSATA